MIRWYISINQETFSLPFSVIDICGILLLLLQLWVIVCVIGYIIYCFVFRAPFLGILPTDYAFSLSFYTKIIWQNVCRIQLYMTEYMKAGGKWKWYCRDGVRYCNKWCKCTLKCLHETWYNISKMQALRVKQLYMNKQTVPASYIYE